MIQWMAPLVFGLVLVPLLAFSAPQLTTVHSMDFTQEPRVDNWQKFMRLDNRKLEVLGNELDIKNFGSFSKINWAWRSAWIKTCQRPDVWGSAEMGVNCRRILENSIIDKAAVIRSEAAKAFGRLFQNSDDRWAIKQLSKSFQSVRSKKRSNPQFVEETIIFALYQINSDAAKKTAQALAKKSPATQAYLQKVLKAQASTSL